MRNNLTGSGKKFVAIISGGNMNFGRLRFVAERAELGERREVLMCFKIPEQPGAYVIFKFSYSRLRFTASSTLKMKTSTFIFCLVLALIRAGHVLVACAAALLHHPARVALSRDGVKRALACARRPKVQRRGSRGAHGRSSTGASGGKERR